MNLNWYKIASQEKWEILSWDEDSPSDYDPVSHVSIQSNLDGKELANALSTALDEQEGIDDPAKVLDWHWDGNAFIIRCQLDEGIGVMKCTRR
jgi:hypothetical protein